MPLVCFLTAVGFFPWATDPATGTKWAILSLTLPVLLLLRPPERRDWPVAAFLLWCALTGLWAPSTALWAVGLWHLSLLASAYLLAPRDMEGCLLGFAAGVAVSGLLAVPQSLGWEGIPQAAAPAGLFMNKNFLAEAGLMALAGVLAYRWRWWLVPPLLWAAVLPVSRGTFVAAGLTGCVWLWSRSRKLAVLVLAIGIGTSAWMLRGQDLIHSSMGSRVSSYLNTAAAIADQPFGHGLGQFWVVYPSYASAVVPSTEKFFGPSRRPKTAHNDALTITVEIGVIGLAFLASAVVVALWRRPSPATWPLLACLFLGLFNFPAFNPATGFLAALCLGHLCRHRDSVRAAEDAGGTSQLPGQPVA